MASERATYEPIARAAAKAHGIDDDLFVRQITQESGWDSDVIHCRRVSSANAQGIAQIVARFHPNVNPCDPVASLEYAAGLMRNYLAAWDGNWALALSSYNAGSGATRSGVNGTLDGWPYAETVRYVSAILQISQSEAARRLTGAAPMPTTLQYNPDAPVDIQTDDFSCSEQSAQWLLRSIGRNPGDAWIRGEMMGTVPPLMTAEYGLMDASGASLAAWMQREYGDEMGLTFTSKNGASWDDLAAIAGKQPLMIGGRAYNHWTGVRRLKDGGLELANPAPQWRDVGVLLDRDEFDRWGSWSYVTVSGSEPAPLPAPVPDELAALRAENDRLRTVIGYASKDISAAIDREVASIRASLAALEAATNTLRGQG